jgi:hypothetical protein
MKPHMSVVIEHGTARCPKCMAFADYSFHEGDGGLLRYQVVCRPCGNVYVELCTSPSVDVSAA